MNFGKDFLSKMLKTQTVLFRNEKTDNKFQYIKIKDFCLSKDSIK